MRWRQILAGLIAGAVLAWACPAAALAATDPPAVASAKKSLADAQSELNKASGALAAIVLKARKELEGSPQFRQAAIGLREAATHQVLATNAVRSKLRQQEDYQKAQDVRLHAELDRNALRDQPNPSPEKLAQAAVALLNASTAVNQIETKAISSDSKVAAAKVEVDQANAALEALRKTAIETMKKDPAYEPARQRVEQASAKVNDANKQVAVAMQQQEQADSQRMNQAIDNRRDQMRNMNPFGR